MYIKLLTKTAVITIGLLFSPLSSAAIVSVDWNSVGDNLITRDTASGLDWLDLTETNDMSYNTVFAEIGDGGQFDGWRYATNSEVVILWSNFGIDLSSNSVTSIGGMDPNVATATLYLGNLLPEYSSQYPNGVLGLTADTFKVTSQYRMGAQTNLNTNRTEYFVADAYAKDQNTPSITTGSYLVQVNAVPIPAAIWLFGSGLIGLIGVAKRKGYNSL